jgi:hypothetical protein
LQSNNVEVLQQQLKQTEDRFQVGEVTRTDVAQSQASLAQGQASAFNARFNLQNSIAVYRQVIGEQPRNLEPARPVEILLPRSLEDATAKAQKSHPRIQAALHAVDVAALNVTIQEGALLPTLTATGTAAVNRDVTGNNNYQNTTYSAIASLSVPLYEGGATYSAVRQAKETLGQARLAADVQRETVRSAVIAAWGAFQTTKLQQFPKPKNRSKRQQNLSSLETDAHVIASASLLIGRKRGVEFGFEDSAVLFHFAASVTAAPDFCGLVGIRSTLQLEQGTTEGSSFTRKRIFTSFAPGGPLSFSSANFSVSASQLPKASLEVFVDVFEKIDSFTVSGRLDERDISGSKKGKKK